MREIHDLNYQDPRHNFLARVTPQSNPRFSTPYAQIQGTPKTVFLKQGTPLGIETLVYCLPANSTHAEKDSFYGIPIEQLDVLNGIALLNQYLPREEGSPEYELGLEAMTQVIDEFEKIRPHKILCAEAKFATPKTLKFLKREGFMEGQPNVSVDQICYVGTFDCNHQPRTQKAIAIGGEIIINDMDTPYIGPVYAVQQTRAGNSQLFRAFAIGKLYEGPLQRKLFHKYWAKEKKHDTPVDKITRRMLGAD